MKTKIQNINEVFRYYIPLFGILPPPDDEKNGQAHAVVAIFYPQHMAMMLTAAKISIRR